MEGYMGWYMLIIPKLGWAEMGISGAQLNLAGKLADSLPREDTRFVL